MKISVLFKSCFSIDPTGYLHNKYIPMGIYLYYIPLGTYTLFQDTWHPIFWNAHAH